MAGFALYRPHAYKYTWTGYSLPGARNQSMTTTNLPVCERVSWAYDLVFVPFPLNMITDVSDTIRCFEDASRFIRSLYFNFVVFLIFKTSFICYDLYVGQSSFNDDGCWHLHWRFGESESFAKMQTLFEAHLTMLILAEVNRFGRIER